MTGRRDGGRVLNSSRKARVILLIDDLLVNINLLVMPSDSKLDIGRKCELVVNFVIRHDAAGISAWLKGSGVIANQARYTHGRSIIEQNSLTV